MTKAQKNQLDTAQGASRLWLTRDYNKHTAQDEQWRFLSFGDTGAGETGKLKSACLEDVFPTNPYTRTHKNIKERGIRGNSTISDYMLRDKTGQNLDFTGSVA